MRVALLEDDRVLHETIREILIKEEYKVSSFYDGESLLGCNEKFDLYILDIMVPKSSGLEVLEILDAKAIIISAHYELQNIQKAYRFGALDFLRKPFFIEELLLKINQLFPKELVLGDILYYPRSATIKKKNEQIILSQKENRLLELLAQNLNKNISYIDIAHKVYHDKESVSGNAIYSLVKRLKQKTGLDILSIPQVGYRLNLP